MRSALTESSSLKVEPYLKGLTTRALILLQMNILWIVGEIYLVSNIKNLK